MPLSDIVNVVLTTDNPGVTAAGFGVDMILSTTAPWVEQTRTYSGIAGVGGDFAVNTPEYMSARALFSQSPAPQSVMIGKGTNKPTQRFSVGVVVPTPANAYAFRFATANVLAWTSQTVTHTAVAAVAWTITTPYVVGQLVVNDTLPLKFYIATIAGTSAGAGGPTGTGAVIVDGTVTWTYAGTGVLGTASNDAIVFNLRRAFDALAAPVVSGVGAAQVTSSLTGVAGTKKLQLLANTAGNFYGLQIGDLAKLSQAQDHADPGVVADLTAIALSSSAWYGVTTLYNSSAYVLAAASFVESNQKLYPVAVMDSEVATVADSIATDVAHALKILSYARTGTFFHPANDEFADAAEIGKFFPYDPGSENWRLKTLAGVSAQNYTQTQVTNLNDKRCNFYYILGGANVIGGDGKVAANEYIDVIRFRDWYVARLSERLVNLLIAAIKVPYTDDGIALIEAQVRAQNQDGIDAGGIASTPVPTVSVPLAASVSPADKAARLLRNVNSNWTLAGAINKLNVNVQVSV